VTATAPRTEPVPDPEPDPEPPTEPDPEPRTEPATVPPTVSATAGTRSFWERHERAAIALAAYLVYTVYALTRWRQQRVAGFDLGIFDQVVRHYAHLETPLVSLKGTGYNIWGDHFHPILVLLAPLYHVWDDARVLLIAQAALVGLSVWVVHGFAARHLDRRTAAFAAVAYALGWPIQNLVDFDFHEIAFALPLLAIAIDALDRRSDRALLWSALTLLLVREDMGILVLTLGLIRVWRRPRWPGVLLIAVGPPVFFAVTNYVLPHFEQSGHFGYWTYTALGPDLPHAVAFIVTHPLATLGVFLSPEIKITKLLLLLAPVAFLALRSRYFWLAVPLLAQSLLSSRADLWGTKWHHSSVLWPIIFLAAIDGAVRLGLPARRWTWRVLRLLVIVFPLLGMVQSAGVYPLRRLFDGHAWSTSDRVIERSQVLAAIPPGTCVEADDNVDVFLTHTNLVSVRGSLGRPPDFYVIDLAKGDMVNAAPAQVWTEAVASGYTQVLTAGQIVLLQRPGYRGPTPECAPN
jgi:uncharacterized membrane protein